MLVNMRTRCLRKGEIGTEMNLIKSVQVEEKQEEKKFSIEYYLRETKECDYERDIAKYDIFLIKKIGNSIVDAAYNKLPYKNLEDAINFIDKLSKNTVTPISFNELLMEDIYEAIS